MSEIIRVAKFEKVTLDQFKKDIIELLPAFDGKDELIETIYNDIELPVRSTKGSAGYDFCAPFSFLPQIDSGITIPTGIRCKIDDGWLLKTYPRSGQGFKYGLYEYNTVGIIDSDYYNADNEGHIMIKIAVREKCEVIERGTRFCQGIFVPYGITYDDNVTEARTGGLGSTGK